MAPYADPPSGDTRERVRETAFKLFGRFGYDGVSMITVARGASLTKAALYWHYASKEALYADCMREVIGVFEQHVFAPAAREQDPIEQIFALFGGLEALVDDPRLVDGIAGYWLKPSTAAVEEARAVQDGFEAMAEQLVQGILEEARAAQALNVEGSMRDIARAFIALMEAVVLPLGNRSARDHRRLVGVLAHIFFQAHARAPELATRAARLLDAAPEQRRTATK
ncbi:TetR/AcrR family transcriptional regulator [Salinisphaera aquimarina]|uniref:TetR/AcrR family transcriptional regulator n=1 Tax=Salinisphaera aquimarina TaxID=2094031 RepID=A0ABV7END9_9GAMM